MATRTVDLIGNQLMRENRDAHNSVHIPAATLCSATRQRPLALSGRRVSSQTLAVPKNNKIIAPRIRILH